MKVKVLLLCITLICSVNLMAQRNCGSMEHLDQMLQEDPKLYQNMKQIERATQQFIDNPDKAVNGIITIPVVVHVVYNTASENISDSQINTQITVLTEDFRRLNSDANGTWPQAADTEIEFCLASVDPSGSGTNGITRTSTSVTSFSTNDNVKFNSSGGKDAWPAADYLNIWVCDLGGGLLGYAQFPGGSPSTDGVVCDYQYFGTNGTATPPFNLGRTATHEVGHWLNLRHIWGDGNCNFDDFVGDTPDSDNPNYGCATGHVSCGSTDMVENYMDYSDDACMNLYTNGQKTRMRAIFDNGGARESLLSSGGCGNATPPSCTDGIQNGNETGVDCGGPDCPACVCNGTEVSLTIVLDNYPEETSWEITDSNNAVVASGGTYGNQPDGSTIAITECLADGCYDFTIFDSYGDGICCAYGNGSYTLVDENNNTLASGGSFGSSETTNFCLGGGSGPSCTDGIQNGNETGIDCGGPDCSPCNTGCSYQLIDDNNFESGWGIWNDGGSDCRRSSSDSAFANSGNYCVRLRDNTSSSVMTTDNLNLNGYSEVTIDFNFLGVSMENGEDLWLQASTNGGASYQTLISWASGSDFSNNVREFETIIITGTFTSSTKFRFRCDASANNDRIYIDDVVITGCYSSTNRETETPQALDSAIEISDYPRIDGVNVFPNPANYILNIDFQMAEESDVEFTVLDMEGKVAHTKQITTQQGTQQISLDISELNSGIYLLHMTSGSERVVKKFSILR